MSGSASKQGHPALKIDAWPQADRDAWDAANRRPDFLDPGGHATTWRPASLRSARGAYGRWLGWLAASDPGHLAEAPAERIIPERMRAYVSFLQEGRSTVTVASYLGVLCMAALAMFPDQDWRWLQALQARLKRRATPLCAKAARLVPVTDLLQLGLDLMQRSEPDLEALPSKSNEPPSRSQVAAARDFRDGLLIAVQASRPLRVKNLLETELGTHLHFGVGQTTLQFKASETKGKRALRTTWPPTLIPALHRYLQQVRPLLMAAPAPGNVAKYRRPSAAHLWVGQGGSPLTPAGLQKLLERHTRARFGHHVNAHLFRDAAATTLVAIDPSHARYAAQLLGHSSLRTTERNYIAADSRLALARHHDLIASTRAEARRAARREKAR